MNTQQQQSTAINYFNSESLESVQRIAKMFCNSDLVPKMYQIGSVGPEKAISNTIIALDMATRLNANPLMVMQNLYVVHGRPSWSSKFLIATINTTGRFAPLKYKFESKGIVKGLQYTEYVYDPATRKNKPVTKTFSDHVENLVCIAYTTAIGSDEVLESSEISIEMAIKEGWYTKSGSKWPTMTKQMLMYRAASFWCNAYAPEISMGIKTIEENEDIEDTEAEVVSTTINDFVPGDEKKPDETQQTPKQSSIMDFASV